MAEIKTTRRRNISRTNSYEQPTINIPVINKEKSNLF